MFYMLLLELCKIFSGSKGSWTTNMFKKPWFQPTPVSLLLEIGYGAQTGTNTRIAQLWEQPWTSAVHLSGSAEKDAELRGEAQWSEHVSIYCGKPIELSKGLAVAGNLVGRAERGVLSDIFKQLNRPNMIPTQLLGVLSRFSTPWRLPLISVSQGPALAVAGIVFKQRDASKPRNKKETARKSQRDIGPSAARSGLFSVQLFCMRILNVSSAPKLSFSWEVCWAVPRQYERDSLHVFWLLTFYSFIRNSIGPVKILKEQEA